MTTFFLISVFISFSSGLHSETGDIWSEALDKAYQAVKELGMSINGSAKRYGVPVKTLRDRVTGKVSLDVTSAGHPPLFDVEEEAKLVEHIKLMAKFGYGYTRSEVVKLASQFAVDLGKREEHSNQLTMPWYYNFMKRWPELQVCQSCEQNLHLKHALTITTLN